MEKFTMPESMITEHIIKIGLFAVVIYFLYYKWRLFQLDDNGEERFFERLIPVMIALDGIDKVIEPYWNVVLDFIWKYI